MFRALTIRQLAVDIAVPVFLGLAYLPLAASRGPIFIPFLAGMAIAAALRRLSPGLALAVAWIVALGQVIAVDSPDVPNVAILAVLFSTSAYGGPVVRWLGFASSFVGAVVVTAALLLPEVWASLSLGALTALVFMFFGSLGVFLLSWTAGLLTSALMRNRESRRAAAIAEQEFAAEQERTRIARDMHDVVAHSLAVVVAQADGARYLGARDPVAMEAALSTIASTAREALSDVRVLLAQLRHSEGDPSQPAPVDIDRLFEQLRAAGLTIAEEVSGTALALPTAQQLAVYRIVQESLTNALRHADSSQPVTVHFGWTPHGLDLTVASALKPPTGRTGAIKTPTASTGHGIAGMTERALLAGGHLTAGPDAGRYAVRAWLPSVASLEPEIPTKASV